jgi:hypothetical protein
VGAHEGCEPAPSRGCRRGLHWGRPPRRAARALPSPNCATPPPPRAHRSFKAFRLLVRGFRRDGLTGADIVVAQVESEPFKVCVGGGRLDWAQTLACGGPPRQPPPSLFTLVRPHSTPPPAAPAPPPGHHQERLRRLPQGGVPQRARGGRAGRLRPGQTGVKHGSSCSQSQRPIIGRTAAPASSLAPRMSLPHTAPHRPLSAPPPPPRSSPTRPSPASARPPSTTSRPPSPASTRVRSLGRAWVQRRHMAGLGQGHLATHAQQQVRRRPTLKYPALSPPPQSRTCCPSWSARRRSPSWRPRCATCSTWRATPPSGAR